MQSAVPLACFLSMIRPPGVQFENALLQIAPVDKAKCPFVHDKNDIDFRLYTRHNPSVYQSLTIDDDERLFASSIDFHSPTVIYFHAFMETSEDGSSSTVREAYTLRGDTNVIMVDASRLEAGPWYFTAAENTWYIGKFAARFIDFLVSRGLDLSKTHLVGHSLGAQAAGVAGASLTSGRVSRITGLDPALPLFAHLPLEQRLDASDAHFVDVIHTDAGIFGVFEPVGHADFYPNGGISPQPGCELEVVIPKHLLLNKCENDSKPRGHYIYHLIPNENKSRDKLERNIIKLFAYLRTATPKVDKDENRSVIETKINTATTKVEGEDVVNNKEVANTKTDTTTPREGLQDSKKVLDKVDTPTLVDRQAVNIKEVVNSKTDTTIPELFREVEDSKKIETKIDTPTPFDRQVVNNSEAKVKKVFKDESNVNKEKVSKSDTESTIAIIEIDNEKGETATDNISEINIKQTDFKDNTNIEDQIMVESVHIPQINILRDALFTLSGPFLDILDILQQNLPQFVTAKPESKDTEYSYGNTEPLEMTDRPNTENVTEHNADKAETPLQHEDGQNIENKQYLPQETLLKHFRQDKNTTDNTRLVKHVQFKTESDYKTNRQENELSEQELPDASFLTQFRQTEDNIEATTQSAEYRRTVDSTEATIQSTDYKNHVVKRQKRFISFFKRDEAQESDNFLFKMLDFLLKNRKNVVPVFTVMREINTLVKSGSGELNHVSKERNNYIGATPPVLTPVTYNLELGNENRAVVFLKKLFGLTPKGDRLSISGK